MQREILHDRCAAQEVQGLRMATGKRRGKAKAHACADGASGIGKMQKVPILAHA